MALPTNFVVFVTMSLAALCAIAEEAAQPTEQKPGEQNGFWSQFMDKEDNHLDMSEWLIENAYGFLPIPLIITEPAVDNGLGLAGVFFHKPKEGDRRDDAEGGFLVTDITAAAAAYTGNDSWFLGGAHFNTMKQDTMRYTGVLGYADINLDFYGSEGTLPPPAESDRIRFNAKGAFTDQKFEWRLGNSNWFGGGEWRYLNSDVSFPKDPIVDDLLGGTQTISGLGVFGHYENVNSRQTPTQGFTAVLSGLWNDEAIGSDFDYEELKWKLRQYFTFKEKWTLAWRFDGATTNGDVPFYLEPFVSIEGIPALRYQGPTAATGELRGGYNFTPRWRAIAFAGGGRVGDKISDLGSAPSHTAVGAGFRYMLAKILGLQVGIDVARGPEETYVYLVTGSAWGTGL